MVQLSNAGATVGATENPGLSERLQGYFRPAMLITKGAFYFFLTILDSPILLLTDFQTFRHKAFSKLWAAYGEEMSSDMPPGTIELVSSCKGIVLDVGPGTGTQLHLFDPAKITKIYGVEPAIDMHAELLRTADEAGLGSKYEAIAAGAEPQSLIPALAKRNLLRTSEKNGVGIFDSIACVRVLCGVPTPEETAEVLFRLLKPGGSLIVCEHVLQPYPNGGDLIAKIMQRFYTLVGWSFWLGGCCLDRDTDKVLRKAAGPDGWSKVDIKYLNTHAAVPYIVGEYIKGSSK